MGESLLNKDLSKIDPNVKAKRLAELREIVAQQKAAQSSSTEQNQPAEGSLLSSLIPKAGDIPELLGGTAGSIVGGLTGIPGARAAGAGIGGSLANMAEQYVKQGNVPAFNYGGIVTPGLTGETKDINWDEVKREGAIQAGGEIIGGIPGKIVKIASPYAKQYVKQGAKEASDWFVRQGGKLNLAQMTDAWFPDFLDSIARSGWLSAGKMQRYGKEQASKIMDVAKGVISSVGEVKPIHEFGKMVKSAIVKADSSERAIAGNMYKKADAIWGKPIVDYSPTMEIAQKIVDSRGAGETGAALAIAKRILRRGSTETFEQAHNDRSSLLTLSRSQKELMSSKNMNDIKDLAMSISRSMDDAGEKLGSFNLELGLNRSPDVERQAYNAYKGASKYYKENVADVFDVKDIKGLVGKERPADIAKETFLPKNPAYVKQLEKAVADPETFESMKASWLSSVFEDATNPQTGELSTKGVLTKIKNMGASYDAMFTSEQRSAQNNLFNTMRMVEEKAASGKPGAIFIQLKQAGAITGAGSLIGGGVGAISGGGQGAQEGALWGVGAGISGSAIIFLTPPLAGRILLSPKLTNYFTYQMKRLPQETPQAIAEISRVLGKITTTGIMNEPEEQEKLPMTPIPSNF